MSCCLPRTDLGNNTVRVPSEITSTMNKIQDDIVDIVCSLEAIKTQTETNPKHRQVKPVNSMSLHTVVADVHQTQDNSTDDVESIVSIDIDVPELPSRPLNISSSQASNSIQEVHHLNFQPLTNQPQ